MNDDFKELEKSLIALPQEIEDIASRDCFSYEQKLAISDLGRAVFYCLNDLNNILKNLKC